MRRGPPLSEGSRTLCVGNLAFGGRGKTPVVAGLAARFEAAGVPTAVLTRGHGGRGTATPLVLRSTGPSARPPWATMLEGSRGGRSQRRVAADWSGEAGDEAPWLAAVLPGVPVGVHADRRSAVSAVLTVLSAQPPLLWILDDGFQNPLPRDLDLVLLDPSRDPPFRPRRLHREGRGALDRADFLGLLGGEAPPTVELPAPVFPLRRRAGRLRGLDGALARPTVPGLAVAGVGSPRSFRRLLDEAGVPWDRALRLADHARPGPLLRRRLASRRGRPLLTTEKDAIRWAARLALPDTAVLEQVIDGLDPLARGLDAALFGRATFRGSEVIGVPAPRAGSADRRP